MARILDCLETGSLFPMKILWRLSITGIRAVAESTNRFVPTLPRVEALETS